MNAELINPFLNATENVLSTMCGITPKAQKPIINVSRGTWGVITGIIGMTSIQYNGNMILSFEESSALSIVNAMLSESYTDINTDVIDAIGELTNMISGGAKQLLSELGHSFGMATPVMITGQGVSINQLSKSPVIQIPFEIDAGSFVVEANLSSTHV